MLNIVSNRKHVLFTIIIAKAQKCIRKMEIKTNKIEVITSAKYISNMGLYYNINSISFPKWWTYLSTIYCTDRSSTTSSLHQNRHVGTMISIDTRGSWLDSMLITIDKSYTDIRALFRRGNKWLTWHRLWCTIGTGSDHDHRLWCTVMTGSDHDHGMWCTIGTGSDHDHRLWCTIGTGSDHDHRLWCTINTGSDHDHMLGCNIRTGSDHDHTVMHDRDRKWSWPYAVMHDRKWKWSWPYVVMHDMDRKWSWS